MIYPNNFYYKQKYSKKRYSYTPTGKLNVSQLIKSKPHWEQSSFIDELKKKTLILADWTAATWDKDRKQAVKAVITTLLEKGFKIYLWQDGNFFALTIEKLHYYLEEDNYLQAITPVLPEKIQDLAVTFLKKPIDELLVLTDYWLDRLVNEKELPRRIRNSDIVQTPHPLTQIFEVIEKAVPPYQAILSNQFYLKNKKLKALKIKFPQLSIIFDVTEGRIDKRCIELLLENKQVIGELSRLDPNKMATVSGFEIHADGLSLRDLAEFLQKTSQLTTLSLEQILLTEELIEWPKNFYTLKNLRLSGVIKGPALNTFLKSLPSLQVLDVDPNIITLKATDLSKISFKFLEVLHLSLKNTANLQKIIDNSPLLKELILQSSGSLQEEIHLGNIKKLSLAGTSLSVIALESLCKHAEQLQQLELIDVGGLEAAVNLNQANLKSLLSLELIRTTISASAFFALLANTESLEKLNLTRCQVLDTNDPDIMLYLPKLKELVVCDVAMSISHLNTLIAHSTDLRQLSLSLSYLNQPAFNTTLKVPIFPNLEILNIDRTVSISVDTLDQLLATSSKLKTLFLRDDSNILLKLPNKDYYLPHLENIDVDGCPRNLLMHLPNLRSFYLRKSSLNFVKKIALKNLINLTISESYFEAECLEHMLSHAQQMQSIKIFNCDFDGYLDKPLFFPHLKILSLKNINEFLKGKIKILIQVLLMSTSCLQRLSLTSLDLYGINLSNVNLMKLEYLNLFNSQFGNKELIQLLKKAPNLKELDLAGYQYSFDPELDSLLNRIPSVYPSNLRENRLASVTDFRYQEQKQTEQIEHSAEHFLDFKPIDQVSFEFEFKGLNKTKDQGMIIEKLSQYFMLTGQHLDIISKLQDGICDALAHLFLQKTDWDEAVQMILAWDGKLETLNDELKKILDEFYQAYINYYVHVQPLSQTYLGNQLPDFLSNHSGDYILKNAWHAIGIKYVKEQKKWIIYDPNQREGILYVDFNELLITIEKSLGRLILIEGKPIFSTAIPLLNDINYFLQNGGLFILYEADNAVDLLPAFSENYAYTKEALEGLLLRATSGEPAWMLAAKKSITKGLTAALMKRFANSFPDDYMLKLSKSLEALTPQTKQEALTLLKQLNLTEPSIADKVSDAIHQSIKQDNFKQYERYFETWRSKKLSALTPLQYCQHIVSSKKKQLIELSSTKNIQALQWALQNFCIKTNRQIFYIDSPEDLICSAPYIERQGNVGHLKAGPGGFLHQFITTEQPPGSLSPLLVINYENFNADDLVKFNTILDNTRRVDGVPLREDIIIIGLININKPDVYHGADFFSRFDVVEKCPIPVNLLDKTIPSLPIQPKTKEEVTSINLFHAADWKERLLGRWTIQKDQLIFQEGELRAAIQSGKSINLQNGLWEDPAFIHFWQQAFLKRYVEQAGERIIMPTHLILTRQEGYTWENFKSYCQFDHVLSVDAITLNSTLLNDFFTQYQFNDQAKTLNMAPGYLAQFAGKSLSVNLTSPLSEDEWGMLLEICRKNNVKLCCHLAPAVSLPAVLADYFNVQSVDVSPHVWANQPDDSSTVIIQSSDIDTTVAQITEMTEHQETWQVIDVSECEASDLFIQINGQLNQTTLKFEFEQKNNALLSGLQADKNIILKGHFNPQLSDTLAAFLASRQREPNKGKLRIISREALPLGQPSFLQHTVTVDEKKACLLRRFSSADQVFDFNKLDFENESLSQLSARILSDHPWVGMKDLLPAFSFPAFNPATSAVEAEAFNQARLDIVNQVLKKSPFVFLTGGTAVGKSTFVEQELIKDGSELYRESAIKAWAKDQSDKRKILFIDEANITQNDWSLFEGLFNQPPGILIEGEYIELTPQHKVVFAGNPLSYGGERTLPNLFEQHGNAVVFEPMPPAFIYEKILKPAFQQSELTEAQILAVCRRFLSAYELICQCSQTEVLISPRELQMMALMTIAHYKQHPEDDLLQIANHYVHAIAKDLIPPSRIKELAYFNNAFKAAKFFGKAQFPTSESFTLTSSRQVLIQHLTDLLMLREFRQKQAVNTTQQYGGLGGIIIEGEPGIGKSELVMSVLKKQGYLEGGTDKPCYVIPVGLELDEKIATLLKAFDDGAVVVIDEINSSPMLERLLNDLLMGKGLDGQRPKKPGFMIIGTQNPITMSGRLATSIALERRMTTVYLPPYSHEEMIAMLVHQGHVPATAETLVKAYENKYEEAKHQQLNPAPTFRDLLRLSSELLSPPVVKPIHIEIPELSSDLTTTSLMSPIGNVEMPKRVKSPIHFIASHPSIPLVGGLILGSVIGVSAVALITAPAIAAAMAGFIPFAASAAILGATGALLGAGVGLLVGGVIALTLKKIVKQQQPTYMAISTEGSPLSSPKVKQGAKVLSTLGNVPREESNISQKSQFNLLDKLRKPMPKMPKKRAASDLSPRLIKKIK